MNSFDDTMGSSPATPAGRQNESLYIDAGVGHIRLRVCRGDGTEIEDTVLPSNRDLRSLFAEQHVVERFGSGADAPIYVTGKLAPMVNKALGGVRTFSHAAAMWLAARDLVTAGGDDSLAMVEISASGYTLIGVDKDGNLKEDCLLVNPRCGAGTGVNLDRVLQKLGMTRGQVDEVLSEYLGESGRAKRETITTRADRCGVFGASATISDKNQGIPLPVALATTLKSEVLKVCRKQPSGFRSVVMLGRFFHWQFARDCANDYLQSTGVTSIEYDPENTVVLDALRGLVETAGPACLAQPDSRLQEETHLNEYPSFGELRTKYQGDRRYCRIPSPEISVPSDLSRRPVHMGLDVGSTMAKVALADDSGEILFLDATSNAGDTIATVKRVFDRLREHGAEGLAVRSIGITGSARYQVRESICRLYPHLANRVAVLVENYAHARGSIDLARHHLAGLKSAGIRGLNEDFCILVDIGGEDTKVSTIALREAELFNNAMNIKCSAGTGSLMDTLSSLFGIAGAAEASAAAMTAGRAYEINATCAVLLIENTQKLLAESTPREEILASANWAIVENMARTLWSQVDLPPHTVVLLHGQTMLSDPLPLAVTHRLQSYLSDPVYGLVPPYPGHRACIGLIRTLMRSAPEGVEIMRLPDFVDAQFEKRIIQCRGAACDDPAAVCNRTSLRCKGLDGRQFSFALGGCSAINELVAGARNRTDGTGEDKTSQPRDTYKEIWDFIDARHPRSDNPRRLVIPRSFVVSEWAHFLSQMFVALGLPVHVDNVRDKDLVAAQPQFDIDSCAPHMGAVGQIRRLASVEKGMILAPQIEKLPTDNKSLGRTCTLNQGGIAVARSLAKSAYPESNITLVSVDFSRLDAGFICDQLFDQLSPVFEFYHMHPGRRTFAAAVEKALKEREQLRADVAALAADLMEEARASGFKVALVVGREYMLNPGIYDSHVRRLLRDKKIAAIPSYVLDVELEECFDHIYWRNSHLISTILHSVAEKRLHERVRQPRLAALIGEMESGPDLLPVVQISTFCCGPDSVTLPLAAELMKKRPYLLIQSDAIVKELAHLENRVNTYVRQLELGLHDRLKHESDTPFEIRALDQLENNQPINRQTDVIYFPTLSDNRFLSTVLRGAGFTCIDNYTEGHDLKALIKRGRSALGDAVCAPMAGVYGDLLRAADDLTRRFREGDPQVAGRTRLLFFDNAGSGPCRQGQYVEVHKLSAHRGRGLRGNDGECHTSGTEAALRFLVARESNGFDFGIEDWTMFRIYQVAVLQGVLHDLLFTGGALCRNYDEYERFHADFVELKEKIFASLENYHGPGPLVRKLTSVFGTPANYVSLFPQERLLAGLLHGFHRRWIRGRALPNGIFTIHVTGEVYMRVAQAEEIFRSLLSILGFGRFVMRVAPGWSYLDYLVEESVGEAGKDLELQKAALTREGKSEALSDGESKARSELQRLGRLRWMLHKVIARPLYNAAGIPIPRPAVETLQTAREILPTLRPIGELGPYLGEVLTGLREGAHLFINVAPTGCMVSAMSQVFASYLRRASSSHGRIQLLLSADGEVNDELLSLAVLKSLGPENFFLRDREASASKQARKDAFAGRRKPDIKEELLRA